MFAVLSKRRGFSGGIPEDFSDEVIVQTESPATNILS